MPRQWWRGVRKTLGLPASADVGIIAQLLGDIAEIAFPDGSSRAALVSYPALAALYQEDLRDAAAYRSIATLRTSGYRNEDQPVELVAALAGHGLGLCKDPLANLTRCNEEERHMQKRHVILFEYTEVALSLDYRQMARPWVDTFAYQRIVQSFELGSAKNATRAQVQAFLLQFIRKEINMGGRCRNIFPDVTVIITGSERSFREEGAQMVMNATVGALEQQGAKADMFFWKPDFVAARGAAEIAWRSPLFNWGWTAQGGLQGGRESSSTNSLAPCSSTVWSDVWRSTPTRMP